MTPVGTRVLRREQRHAWRGMATGRHPRPVRTTFGRKQKAAAWLAQWQLMRAQQAEQREAQS